MNIGDVITTAEQLEAVPPGSLLQGRYHDELPWTTTAGGMQWDLIEYAAPLTVIYIPGQLPRPERVVKAEALREAAEAWQTGGWAEDSPPGQSRPALILGMAQRAVDYLRRRADRIEAGDAL